MIVASNSHMFVDETRENFDFKEKARVPKSSGIYGTLIQYSYSKLMNILHTKYLHNLLHSYGITVNCLHPGIIDTEIIREWNPILQLVARPFMKIFAKTTFQGAQNTVHVATKQDDISGEYYDNLDIGYPTDLSKDLKYAKELWEWSDQECRKSCSLYDSWLKNNQEIKMNNEFQ